MRDFLALLKLPGLGLVITTQLIARFPAGMYSLGILMLVLTGLIVGLGTSAPLLSRLWGEPAQVGPDYAHSDEFVIGLDLILDALEQRLSAVGLQVEGRQGP